MRILIFIIVLILTFACTRTKRIKDSVRIEFEHTAYDLSKIRIKDSTICRVKFWNRGTGALIINKVKPSCSCVRVDWPKKPIAKDCSEQIKAVYYTEHPSTISEVIYIYYNAEDSPALVTITGVADDK